MWGLWQRCALIFPFLGFRPLVLGFGSLGVGFGPWGAVVGFLPIVVWDLDLALLFLPFPCPF